MDDSERHLAQLRAHYLTAIWAGDTDAAEIIRNEIDRLERQRCDEDARQ